MDTTSSLIDEMYHSGLEMKRSQIRRQDPTLNEEAVEALLHEWILDRPMDAPGRVRIM